MAQLHHDRAAQLRLVRLLRTVPAAPPGPGADTSDAINDRALAVIRRIQAKLAGRDFAEGDPIGQLMSAGIGLLAGAGGGGAASDTLDVQAQVHRLIAAATSHENLAQAYTGWCRYVRRRLLPLTHKRTHSLSPSLARSSYRAQRRS